MNLAGRASRPAPRSPARMPRMLAGAFAVWLVAGCDETWNVDGILIDGNALPARPEATVAACPDLSGAYVSEPQPAAARDPIVLPAILQPLSAQSMQPQDPAFAAAPGVRIQRAGAGWSAKGLSNDGQDTAQGIALPAPGRHEDADSGPPNGSLVWCAGGAWIVRSAWLDIHAGENTTSTTHVGVVRARDDGLYVSVRSRSVHRGLLPIPRADESAARYRFARRDAGPRTDHAP